MVIGIRWGKTITIVYKVLKTQKNVHHVHPFLCLPSKKNSSRPQKYGTGAVWNYTRMCFTDS